MKRPFQLWFREGLRNIAEPVLSIVIFLSYFGLAFVFSIWGGIHPEGTEDSSIGDECDTEYRNIMASLGDDTIQVYMSTDPNCWGDFPSWEIK